MHRDDLRVIWPESGRSEAALIILEAPSIAPNSNTNPSFRFYYYNTTSYALLDYDEYYTDLINNYLSVCNTRLVSSLCSKQQQHLWL
jgi:hypothetical protein